MLARTSLDTREVSARLAFWVNVVFGPGKHCSGKPLFSTLPSNILENLIPSFFRIAVVMGVEKQAGMRSKVTAIVTLATFL